MAISSVIDVAPPRQIDLLVDGGTLVTVDGERRVIDDGAIAIDGGRIIEVGPRATVAPRFSARRRLTPFEIENSRQRFGKTDLRVLEQLGVLGPDFLAVHCVYLDAGDVQTLAANGVAVSHNPTSNMYLSSGVAPVPAMVRAGVPVGLASDGPASNNTHNMIQSLKFAALLHKVATRDPTVITGETVLEMATIGGARALGMDREIGSLESGKRADLFVADLGASPFCSPVHHPVSALVYSAAGHEVETVVVDGRVVLHEGHLTTASEERIRGAAQMAADRLVTRSGTDALRKRPWRSTLV